MERLAWIPEPFRAHIRKPVLWYRRQKERRHGYALLKSLGRRLSVSKEYEGYLIDQVTRSWSMRTKTDQDNRVQKLIDKFLQHDGQPNGSRSVLCVGCRNLHEIAVFKRRGFGRVVGIDLFTIHDDILQMDMHLMNFPDDHFDVVFSCHSLEHSYDPTKALSEFARVLRPGGGCIIEVPIRFQRSSSDLQDFGSVEALVAACRPFMDRVLFAEEVENANVSCAKLAFTSKTTQNAKQVS